MIFQIRYNHIEDLLAPLSMEFRHLRPVGFILDADARKADHNLRSLTVIIALPGHLSAESGFNGRLFRIVEVTGSNPVCSTIKGLKL